MVLISLLRSLNWGYNNIDLNSILIDKTIFNISIITEIIAESKQSIQISQSFFNYSR